MWCGRRPIRPRTGGRSRRGPRPPPGGWPIPGSCWRRSSALPSPRSRSGAPAERTTAAESGTAPSPSDPKSRRRERKGPSDGEDGKAQVADHPDVVLRRSSGRGQVVARHRPGRPRGEHEALQVPKIHLAASADDDLPPGVDEPHHRDDLEAVEGGEFPPPLDRGPRDRVEEVDRDRVHGKLPKGHGQLDAVQGRLADAEDPPAADPRPGRLRLPDRTDVLLVVVRRAHRGKEASGRLEVVVQRPKPPRKKVGHILGRQGPEAHARLDPHLGPDPLLRFPPVRAPRGCASQDPTTRSRTPWLRGPSPPGRPGPSPPLRSAGISGCRLSTGGTGSRRSNPPSTAPISRSRWSRV